MVIFIFKVECLSIRNGEKQLGMLLQMNGRKERND